MFLLPHLSSNISKNSHKKRAVIPFFSTSRINSKHYLNLNSKIYLNSAHILTKVKTWWVRFTPSQTRFWHFASIQNVSDSHRSKHRKQVGTLCIEKDISIQNVLVGAFPALDHRLLSHSSCSLHLEPPSPNDYSLFSNLKEDTVLNNFQENVVYWK